MRILVISDTHRQNDNYKRLIKAAGKLDLLVHLGDAEGGEAEIQRLAGCICEFVAGNNDFFCDLPREKEIMIGNYRVLLTHGHYYYVSLGTEALKKEGRARDIDIIMFGHTHRPMLDMDTDITVLNPGSLSYPRQEGRRPSYILMELDDKGQAHYTVNYLKK